MSADTEHRKLLTSVLRLPLFLNRAGLHKLLMRTFGCLARTRTSQFTRIVTTNASLLRVDEKLTAFLELGAGACAGLA